MNFFGHFKIISVYGRKKQLPIDMKPRMMDCCNSLLLLAEY